jgi:DNA modification methylase
VDLKDLKPDSRNANKGTERGRRMVEKSLRNYGAGRSILLDRNGAIIAGNKTAEGAAAIGLTDVVVVESDGTRLVAVKRTDIDLDSKAGRELAIADNRAGELGLEWDPAVLKGLDAELTEFWNDSELDHLMDGMAGFGQDAAAPDPQLDRAEELAALWGPKPGQTWLIGAHRLFCGDSTDPAAWRALMGNATAQMAFTDPPWNVGIGGDNNPRHRQRKGLANDALSAEDFAKFIGGFAGNLGNHLVGDLYCVLGASEWPTLDTQLRGAGFHWSATIIWVKDLFVLGRSKYHRRYEPIWYGWHSKSKSSFCGSRDLDDVWEIPRPRISDEHPTMKPIELVARAIRNSSERAGIVVDPFCGSGTTMVAAQTLGRSCYAIELEPKYVAVALQRLADMGLAPKLA